MIFSVSKEISMKDYDYLVVSGLPDSIQITSCKRISPSSQIYSKLLKQFGREPSFEAVVTPQVPFYDGRYCIVGSASGQAILDHFVILSYNDNGKVRTKIACAFSFGYSCVPLQGNWQSSNISFFSDYEKNIIDKEGCYILCLAAAQHLERGLSFFQMVKLNLAEIGHNSEKAQALLNYRIIQVRQTPMSHYCLFDKDNVCIFDPLGQLQGRRLSSIKSDKAENVVSINQRKQKNEVSKSGIKQKKVKKTGESGSDVYVPSLDDFYNFQ